jgi:hypothetical protein
VRGFAEWLGSVGFHRDSTLRCRSVTAGDLHWLVLAASAVVGAGGHSEQHARRGGAVAEPVARRSPRSFDLPVQMPKPRAASCGLSPDAAIGRRNAHSARRGSGLSPNHRPDGHVEVLTRVARRAINRHTSHPAASLGRKCPTTDHVRPGGVRTARSIRTATPNNTRAASGGITCT